MAAWTEWRSVPASVGSTRKRRDRPLLDAEQVSGRADVHDDRHVQDDRAGFVQAHDGERPVADPESVCPPSSAGHRERGFPGRSWC